MRQLTYHMSQLIFHPLHSSNVQQVSEQYGDYPATSLWHCNLSDESDQGMSQEFGIIGAEQ